MNSSTHRSTYSQRDHFRGKWYLRWVPSIKSFQCPFSQTMTRKAIVLILFVNKSGVIPFWLLEFRNSSPATTFQEMYFRWIFGAEFEYCSVRAQGIYLNQLVIRHIEHTLHWIEMVLKTQQINAWSRGGGWIRSPLGVWQFALDFHDVLWPYSSVIYIFRISRFQAWKVLGTHISIGHILGCWASKVVV